MAKLNAENTENERLVDQLRNENATLRKTVDELDENCDNLKRQRDDANKQVEEILREMNEMAWTPILTVNTPTLYMYRFEQTIIRNF